MKLIVARPQEIHFKLCYFSLTRYVKINRRTYHLPLEIFLQSITWNEMVHLSLKFLKMLSDDRCFVSNYMKRTCILSRNVLTSSINSVFVFISCIRGDFLKLFK